MNLYDATVPIFTNSLRQLDRWLDKAVAYADRRKFDPEILVQSRLAPDAYALVGQIQSACDTAKFTSARLGGKKAPSHPDTETTLAECRARIASVLGYLAEFKREEFVGAEERPCGANWMEGRTMRGGDYLDQFALPNFHFHLTMAYAILRHNGVELGKPDYLGNLTFLP